MHPILDPREKATEFAFDGSDCLYRDHLGRRVLADVEGFGYVEVESELLDLTIEADEDRASAATTGFGRSLLVAANGPGAAKVRVVTGRSQPVVGTTEAVGNSVNGSGWVVSAQGLTVDETHRPAARPDERFPVPFFRSSAADGPMQIIRARAVCQRIDSFDIDDEEGLRQRDFKVQNISAISTLDSTFADGFQRIATVASHLNAAHWRLAIPPGSTGLIVRRIYDRFHGRQRARVLVDGQFVGWWYEPDQDRKHRWSVSDFGIPAEYIAGKLQITLSIDPPAGSPLWSVSQIETFAIQ